MTDLRNMQWRDLDPHPGMLRALDEADRAVPRSQALRGQREERHRWSNAFADATARMLAKSMRSRAAFSPFNLLPDEGGRGEPPTFVTGDRKKRVDVVVTSPVSGLQVGVSLKGMNFRDGSGAQFDKNLTGRTYELQDEIRVIHEYQPAALLVALYLLPLAATCDKRSETSPSSLARTVLHLRSRTGRLDWSLPSQAAKADLSIVGIYVPGDVEFDADGQVYYQDAPHARGVVRFLDVRRAPPHRGRPLLKDTLDLDGVVDLIVRTYRPNLDEQTLWGPAEV